MNKSQSNPSAPGEAMLGNKLRPAVLPADGIRRPGCKWCETSDDLDQADRQQLDELGRAGLYVSGRLSECLLRRPLFPNHRGVPGHGRSSGLQRNRDSGRLRWACRPILI